jgi:Glu-tRNA(Gln) amidotransferase subunit E-like FAD-binding protein
MQTFGFLVGQVMKASKGKANPKLVNDCLKRSSVSLIMAPPLAILNSLRPSE